jgi:hypothetical protein
MGVQKHTKKRFEKNIVSKSVYKKSTQNPNPIFPRFSFITTFWAFLGEGSSKTRSNKKTNLTPFFFRTLIHPPTTGVTDFFGGFLCLVPAGSWQLPAARRHCQAWPRAGAGGFQELSWCHTPHTHRRRAPRELDVARAWPRAIPAPSCPPAARRLAPKKKAKTRGGKAIHLKPRTCLLLIKNGD